MPDRERVRSSIGGTRSGDESVSRSGRRGWIDLGRGRALPLVDRERRIHDHVVGDPEALQTVLDRAPEALVLRDDGIGQFPSARANPAPKLSERQREALEAARDLGYYDQPREATHEEIAGVLGCAPSTASDHLQKAEAKLVHAVTGDVGVEI